MEEKVLKMISMCLMAKDMGHDVFFHYYPHVQKIEIYAFGSKNNYESDDELNYIFHYHCYIDEQGCVDTFNNMKTAIQKLIDGDFE